jgi:multiple sugar transport system substrate-binding protein
MKKFLKIAVMFIISIFLFTGCSMTKKETLNPDNPVSLVIWHYYNGVQKTAFDELVAEFNETEGLKKGIAVEAFSQGNVDDLERKVMESVTKKIGSEPMPDMFAAYADNAYQIDKLGFATDISEYLTLEEIGEYIDSYIQEGRFGDGDEIKIFPTAKATEIMMLNKTDWDKFASATGASLDDLRTWEGVAETAKKYYEWTDALTLTPDDGKAFFGRDAMANYMLVGSKQLGSEMFSVKDGQVSLTIDDAVMKRLWDNFYIPYINGYYKAVGKFRSDDAKTGEIIALVCSTSGIAYFPDTVVINDNTEYNIEALTLPLPNFENTLCYAVQQGAGMVVVKSDKIREHASVEFLKWFTEKDKNISFCMQSGYVPVKKESIDINAMEEFLSNNKDKRAADKLQAALPTLIGQMQTYELYTTKAFEHGTDAREILGKSLLEKSKIDREKVIGLLKEGRTREEAVKQFATDENFNEWLAGLKKDLADVIK